MTMTTDDAPHWTPKDLDDAVSPAEYAKLMRVSVHTVWREIHANKIEVFRVSPRIVYIPRRELTRRRAELGIHEG